MVPFKTLSRLERAKEAEACRVEKVKSVFGTKTGNSLEKKILDHIKESRERDERIEKMMKTFVENTVSSLKTHEDRIKGLEKSVSSCSQAITDYLAAREEEVVTTVETIFEEPTTFSEKVKRRISMEKLSLLDKALPEYPEN